MAGNGVRAATLTIMGQVASGTPFDPAKIGAAMLSMATTTAEQFQPEVLFKGA